MLYKVTHCVQCFLTNKTHQLCWVDQEIGTAILCKKGSQVAGLINVVDNSISKIVSLHIAVLVIATIGCTYLSCGDDIQAGETKLR